MQEQCVTLEIQREKLDRERRWVMPAALIIACKQLEGHSWPLSQDKAVKFITGIFWWSLRSRATLGLTGQVVDDFQNFLGLLEKVQHCSLQRFRCRLPQAAENG